MYYQDIGDYQSADEIISILRYPAKSDILYSQSDIAPLMFRLAIKISRREESFDKDIDLICQQLEKLIIDSKGNTGNIAAYMPNDLILVYCASIELDNLTRCFTEEWYSKTDEKKIELRLYFETLYDYIKSHDKIFSPVWLVYYECIYSIIFTPNEEINYDHFVRFNEEVISKTGNLKIKLQLLATLIIRLSCYIEKSSNNINEGIRLTRFLFCSLYLPFIHELSKAVFLPKYTFKLCAFVVAICRNFLFKHIYPNAEYIKSMIAKCTTLSDDEIEEYRIILLSSELIQLPK